MISIFTAATSFQSPKGDSARVADTFLTTRVVLASAHLKGFGERMVENVR